MHTRTAFCLAVACLALAAFAPAATAQERVAFPSSDTDLTAGAPTRLEGLLLRPSGDGPFSAMVLMHGCGGLHRPDGRLIKQYQAWAEGLREDGYLVLLVDSFGPRGIRQICTVKARTVRPGRERTRDAYGALRYLQGRSDVLAENVGLLGWSNGGSTVLWTLDPDNRGRPPALPHGDYRVAVAFYPGCRDLLERAGWLPSPPLLILIGELDDWTPAEPCRDLVDLANARGAGTDIVVYPDAYHGFDAPDVPIRIRRNIATTRSGTATVGTHPTARADALEQVALFLAEHLRP